MLKLHDLDRSPFCWKVRLVLAEKGIPHELVTPQDKSNDPAFEKINPFRLTPVLQLSDNRSIYESTVICEYLEEAYPDPALLPHDPFERARIRMIEDTSDQYLYPAMRGWVTSQYTYDPPLLRRKPASEVDEKLREESRAKIEKHLTYLEEQIGDRRWFGGDLFSLADCALAPPLTGGMRLHQFLPSERWPRIGAWAARVAERSSFMRTAPKVPMSIEG
jgi:glutathione S-transferase